MDCKLLVCVLSASGVKIRGEQVPLPEKMHVFGAYNLFTISKELRGDTFRPKSEMGIWCEG